MDDLKIRLRTGLPLRKIISGGQTGADQAGLVAASRLKLETGGWMPAGFLTEDGPAPDMANFFQLREHASPLYPPRTRRNVKESDGTVWFGPLSSRGAMVTQRSAVELSKPFLQNPGPAALRQWVTDLDIRVLNVAGTRASHDREVYERTVQTLVLAFGVLDD